VADWASSVLAANPDKEVIVITHSYMHFDGTRVDQCDTGDLNFNNYGDKLWAKLISQFPNVDIVVSGHVTGALGSRRADLGVHGNLVNQMFSNYQSLANGGNGYLRVLTFHPLANTVDVKTYSPYLNAYKTDAANQFTINFHAPLTTATTGSVSGLARNASTCKPIVGATVTSGAISTLTDSNGHYSFTMLPGDHVLNATMNGYYAGSQTATVKNGYDTDTKFFLQSPCALNPVSPSVTICTPLANAVVESPLQITAGTTNLNPVSYVQLYVDGVYQTTQTGGILSTSTSLAPGAHRITVQAKDFTGLLFKQTLNVTVNVAACTPNPLSPSVTICSPQANAKVSSPVSVVAVSTNVLLVSWMQLYADGVKTTQQAGGSLNASATLAAGSHRLTVQSVDSKGAVVKQTVYITVQ
jgi:hypothetical protein